MSIDGRQQGRSQRATTFVFSCFATAAVVMVLTASPRAVAAQDAEALARKMYNPIAAVISLPFQFNFDRDIGANRDGSRTTLNIQPVVPMSLSHDWNIISRTIMPVVGQDVPRLGDGSQSGIGDVVQSFFFSPKKPGPNGLIWGVGPVMLIPSGTHFISADKWGLGPTGAALKVDGQMTYGVLANHIWAVAGSGRQDISSTFIQPFFTYTLKSATSFTIQTESTYDWNNRQWNVPVALLVGQLMKLGDQPVQLTAGVRYYAGSPTNGPHGVAFRLAVTFLFPK
jgi:hypothetical protein